MTRWSLLALTVAFLLPAAAALAQTEGANNARGFQPGKVYDFFGLDSVDEFSGNEIGIGTSSPTATLDILRA